MDTSPKLNDKDNRDLTIGMLTQRISQLPTHKLALVLMYVQGVASLK